MKSKVSLEEKITQLERRIRCLEEQKAEVKADAFKRIWSEGNEAWKNTTLYKHMCNTQQKKLV